jgi:ligand-binding sensor domain-containing protein
MITMRNFLIDMIAEIGLESALSASCDTKDNVYVATDVGLFYIKAHTKGKNIEQVEHFKGKKISTVHVDWYQNNTLYVAVEQDGLYRLTYGTYNMYIHK